MFTLQLERLFCGSTITYVYNFGSKGSKRHSYKRAIAAFQNVTIVRIFSLAGRYALDVHEVMKNIKSLHLIKLI